MAEVKALNQLPDCFVVWCGPARQRRQGRGDEGVRGTTLRASKAAAPGHGAPPCSRARRWLYDNLLVIRCVSS
jgi:hypothetical protein